MNCSDLVVGIDVAVSSSAAFDARVGCYEFAPGFQISLTREGERFYAQATGQPKLEIFAASDEVYFSTAVEAELRFQARERRFSKQWKLRRLAPSP